MPDEFEDGRKAVKDALEAYTASDLDPESSNSAKKALAKEVRTVAGRLYQDVLA